MIPFRGSLRLEQFLKFSANTYHIALNYIQFHCMLKLALLLRAQAYPLQEQCLQMATAISCAGYKAGWRSPWSKNICHLTPSNTLGLLESALAKSWERIQEALHWASKPNTEDTIWQRVPLPIPLLDLSFPPFCFPSRLEMPPPCPPATYLLLFEVYLSSSGSQGMLYGINRVV